MRRYRYNAAGAVQMHTPGEQARYEAGHERIFGGGGGGGGQRTRAAGTRGQSPAQKRARRREAMFRTLRSKGRKTKSAARAAMRAYPFPKSSTATSYHGVRRGRRGKGGATRRQPKQYSHVTTTGRRKKVVRVRVRRRVRVAYGRYRRARLRDPSTGRKRLSYMYRDKRGRYRKIPARAIASVPRGRRRKGTARGFQEVGRAARAARNMERIRRARERASARVLRSGGPFVPNSRRRAKMRLSKRARAARKGWRRRRALKANRRGGKRWTHRRKTGKGRGRRGRHLARGRIYYRGRKPRYLRGVRRARRLPRGKVLLTNRRRPRRRRARRARANARYEENRRPRRRRHRRRANARRYAENRRPRRRHRRRRANARRYAENRRPRRRRHRRHRANARRYAENRRHHRRAGRRRHRNRRYTANAFFADLKAVAKSALFVTVGFIGHKVITNLLAVKVIGKALAKSGNATLLKLVPYTPIFTGVPVALLGIWASGKVAPKFRTELGGGMIAALIHTTIVTALGASTSTSKYRSYLAGSDRMGRSSAWALQGRGMQGLGQGPTSILPHYRALGPGAIQQAVAGRGTGEYFQVQTSGLGEYFVQGAQGVGNYELAGPMVTSAAAGFGQVIEDGIRPDSDLDALLTLAESQAGLGEYYAARKHDGSVEQYVVPQQSQWVPNGPLWAGTMPAEDSTARAELPAGILETPGGNGVFG